MPASIGPDIPRFALLLSRGQWEHTTTSFGNHLTAAELDDYCCGFRDPGARMHLQDCSGCQARLIRLHRNLMQVGPGDRAPAGRGSWNRQHETVWTDRVKRRNEYLLATVIALCIALALCLDLLHLGFTH